MDNPCCGAVARGNSHRILLPYLKTVDAREKESIMVLRRKVCKIILMLLFITPIALKKKGFFQKRNEKYAALHINACLPFQKKTAKPPIFKKHSISQTLFAPDLLSIHLSHWLTLSAQMFLSPSKPQSTNWRRGDEEEEEEESSSVSPPAVSTKQEPLHFWGGY